MRSDTTRFAHHGESWSARANRGELKSVLYSNGPERVNLMMHGATLEGANVALRLNPGCGVLLDFGCGTGRMLRFFCARGWSVIGTEVTPEMLDQARQLGLPTKSEVYLTDGVSIPLPDGSVDLIWICGVLKYSLLEPNSISRGGSGPDEVAFPHERSGEAEPNAQIRSHEKIVMEMYRVLRPGGLIVNVEMYVDGPPEMFAADFQRMGFSLKRRGVLRRYKGSLERLCEWRAWHRLPPRLVVAAGRAIGVLRLWLDNPERKGGGLRDYLFVWSKPSP